MSAAPTQPQLRLVGNEHPASVAAWDGTEGVTQAVVRENRAAARTAVLEPTDPRWVLAVRARSQLQGSALSPERRARLLRLAEQLRIRPFDANVIIAIVQDNARRGAGLGDAAPTLAMIAAPDERATGREWLRWTAAIAAALTANALLVWWLLAG